MTTVYVIFKTGVYRHEGGGVYSTRKLAIAAAKKLATLEQDRHHSLSVVLFELDAIPEVANGDDMITRFKEHYPIFTCSHGDWE